MYIRQQLVKTKLATDNNSAEHSTSVAEQPEPSLGLNVCKYKHPVSGGGGRDTGATRRYLSGLPEAILMPMFWIYTSLS